MALNEQMNLQHFFSNSVTLLRLLRRKEVNAGRVHSRSFYRCRLGVGGVLHE